MDTDTISSNPAQILSGQHTAMLETTARKAFPAVTQSDLRLKFLDILLLIAQGSSAPDSQLDSFLVRNGNGRSCTVGDCGQTFKRRDRARDHIRVHLDYRPYACDGQCGKAECRARFHAVSALNTHQGQCEHQCPHCGATVLRHNRRRHTKTQRCRNAVATQTSPETQSEAD